MFFHKLYDAKAMILALLKKKTFAIDEIIILLARLNLFLLFLISSNFARGNYWHDEKWQGSFRSRLSTIT